MSPLKNPDIRPELILPAGMTAVEAWTKHCQPILFTHYSVTGSKQLVPHRGLLDYARGISDGSMKALFTATAGVDGNRGNLAELDVLWIRGESYVMHDSTGGRQTRTWSNSSLQPGGEMPYFIIRDVEGSQCREQHITTNNKVTELIHTLYLLMRENSKATFFLDAHYEDGAKVTASLSKHPIAHDNSLIQIYPYTNRSGAEFVDEVECLKAEHGWKRKIRIVPVLNADALPRLAGTGYKELDYNKLLKAGQTWFSSMVKADLNIFGFGIPASGIGRYFDLESQVAHGLDGKVINDPKIKAMFLWDRVLLDLIPWAKKEHRLLPIIGVSITYSYSYNGERYTNSFHTGYPIAWPAGAESHGMELMAVPGNAFTLGADIVICDRTVDNLNVLLGTKTYSWPEDVNYPA